MKLFALSVLILSAAAHAAEDPVSRPALEQLAREACGSAARYAALSTFHDEYPSAEATGASVEADGTGYRVIVAAAPYGVTYVYAVATDLSGGEPLGDGKFNAATLRCEARIPERISP
jgi:hypothetical protein